MTPERLRLRAVGGLGLVIGALGLLLLRLGWLHLAAGPEMRASARVQHFTREEKVRAVRGSILDRNGVVLAETENRPSVAVDPKLVEDPQRFAAEVARGLGIPAAEVLSAVRHGGRFRWLRRQVADRAAVDRLRLRLRALGMHGLVVQEEPQRLHPFGPLAAQVLGFTDRDGRGLEGVEALRDRELAGRDGRRIALRDASGTPIALPGELFDPPEDGAAVRLTLDHVIQSFAENAAEEISAKYPAKGVVAAVVDVPTGELLAVACRPTYDPDDPARSAADQRRNRFFCDAFEPGSVFKPLVMGAALDAGVVTPESRIDTEGGRIRLRGRTIREDRDHDYGVVTPRDVIARSSNVGMVKVGLLLGSERMRSSLRLLGFGARTAVRWPGEQPGDVQAKVRWRDHDQLASVAFGHSLTTTPAQLLQGYATLAGGGVRRELRLFADVPASEPVRVMGERAAADLLPMVEAVVADRNGTAWLPGRQCPDFRIGGKTGTAQKLATGGHVGSFACFGPVEEPRLAVLVLVDEPRRASYGSVVAAPFAITLLRRSLHYLCVEPSAVRAARTEAQAARAVRTDDPAAHRPFVNREVAPR